MDSNYNKGDNRWIVITTNVISEKIDNLSQSSNRKITHSVLYHRPLIYHSFIYSIINTKTKFQPERKQILTSLQSQLRLTQRHTLDFIIAIPQIMLNSVTHA